MRYPSVKAIRAAFPTADARAIRRIMEGPTIDNLGRGRLERIDWHLGTFGVEWIPAGHNLKSPAIYYCNTGDTYTRTILLVHGRFRIGSWGDIVERGHYD